MTAAKKTEDLEEPEEEIISSGTPKRSRAKAKGPEKIVKYLIKTSQGRGDGGETIIEVPESWKLTFAAVNPANAKGYGGDGYCVRVYEMPGNKLRAVFDSVTSFRDVSIPLVRKIKSEMGSASWQRDSMGNFKKEEEVKVDFELMPVNDDYDVDDF